jgi:hypothetical protein
MTRFSKHSRNSSVIEIFLEKQPFDLFQNSASVADNCNYVYARQLLSLKDVFLHQKESFPRSKRGKS